MGILLVLLVIIFICSLVFNFGVGLLDFVLSPKKILIAIIIVAVIMLIKG